MKIIKFRLTAYIVICAFFSYGQTFNYDYRSLDSLVLASDPNYATRQITYENALLDSTDKYGIDILLARTSDFEMPSVRIPIVLHNIGAPSIYGYAAQNLINALNDIYSNANNGPGVNTQIQFCLARLDPEGNATGGITNHPDVPGAFCMNDDNSIKSIVSWNTNKYLNIWVCNLTNCGVEAWGTPPTQFFQNASTKYRDGVVCDMSIINNLGMRPIILAREIARWLSLRHTFGDGFSACGTTGNSDLVSDTPWCFGSSGATFPSCTGAVQSQCSTANSNPPINNASEPRQIDNYMDDADEQCRKRFTLGQKIRMNFCVLNTRLEINDISSEISKCGDHCVNGIKDSDETGIDCGGSCPSCIELVCPSSIQFSVNGQSTQPGNFINVCNDLNIKLNPGLFGHNCEHTSWKTVKACEWSEHQPENSFDCDFSVLRQKWNCCRHLLFVSIQECDEYKNLIGTEFFDWLPIQAIRVPMSQDIDISSALSLLGTTISNGKLYKIKVATSNPSWSYCVGYIKVFKSSLILSSKTINIDEYADYLTFNDCIINTTKSVAQYQIDVTGESTLKDGHYEIATFNCSLLPTFRIVSNTIQHPLNTILSDQTTLNVNRADYSNANEIGVKKISLKIIPNPTDGMVKISLINSTTPASSIEITNLSGVILYADRNITQKGIEIDLKSLPQGVYLVKVNYQGLNYNTRLIKQ